MYVYRRFNGEYPLYLFIREGVYSCFHALRLLPLCCLFLCTSLLMSSRPVFLSRSHVFLLFLSFSIHPLFTMFIFLLLLCSISGMFNLIEFITMKKCIKGKKVKEFLCFFKAHVLRRCKLFWTAAIQLLSTMVHVYHVRFFSFNI